VAAKAPLDVIFTFEGRNVTGTVQRAFEIAPECRSIDEIRIKLRQEGHASVQEHLQGSSIQKELKLRLGGKTG
jgi:hypothetical protein